MMTVNAMGDACPIPVVKTKKAMETLKAGDVVETYVDNEIAGGKPDQDGETDWLCSDKPETGRRKIQRTDYGVGSSKRSRKYAGSELWPNTGIQQSRGHPQLGYG